MTLKLMVSVQELKEFRASIASNKTIGFVPTMGALHEGHGSLIEKSASENNETVVSIFVNPTQFGPNEDFSSYPRTLQQDLDLAEKYGATAVFAPTIEAIYPKNFRTYVNVTKMDKVLCGASRENHFTGVCTIVLILLNLVNASKAYFGLKDFQQFTILKRMTFDIHHQTELVGLPTSRENDGLARSSRNRYLNEEQRVTAKAVPKSLAVAAKLFLNGEVNSKVLLEQALGKLEESGLVPEYLEIRDIVALELVEGDLNVEVVMALAQRIAVENGSCRLIDNIVLSNNEPYKGYLENLVALADV